MASQDQNRMRELQDAGLWPEIVPRDYNALHAQWAAFVLYFVRKYNKVDSDPRDLINHIWMRLIESDVLVKYVEAALAEPPATMTGKEACAFLGLNWHQWRFYFWRGTKGYIDAKGVRHVLPRYIPTPINEKGCYSKKAVFRTEDIVKMLHSIEDTGCFHKRGAVTVTKPAYAKKHFAGYLQRCIHHAFVNWCRTRTRRYQEHLGEDKSPASSDQTVREHWSNRLADEESFSVEENAAVLHFADQLKKVVPEHADELFGLLQQGYTLPEAVNKMDVAKATMRAIKFKLRALA